MDFASSIFGHQNIIMFHFSDSIVRKSMAFELYPYLSYVPIAFNLLFAQVHPPKIVIPSKARETTQRIKVCILLEALTNLFGKFYCLMRIE